MDEELIPLTEEDLARDIAVMLAARIIEPPNLSRRDTRDEERKRWADEFAAELTRRRLRFFRIKPALGNQ
jgi:hypothetical protein